MDIDGVGIQGTPYMKLMKEEEEKKWKFKDKKGYFDKINRVRKRLTLRKGT